MKRYIGYIVLTVIQVFVLHFMKQKVFAGQYDLIAFLVEGVISVAVSVAAVSVCYFRTEEYKYLTDILKGIVTKILGKRKSKNS